MSGTDRAILSWNGKKPTTLYGITAYTHSQIRDIVSDTDGTGIQTLTTTLKILVPVNFELEA